MSYLIAAPELVEAAAGDLAGIHSALRAVTAAAAAPTTGVVPAAEDEISVGIASVFGTYAREYQVLSADAAAFHAQFVQTLNAAAGYYAAAEAANASPMQTMLNAVNAPAQALLGAR